MHTSLVLAQLRYSLGPDLYMAQSQPSVWAPSLATSRAPATETSATSPSDALCVPSYGGSPGECDHRTRLHSCVALAHRSPRRRLSSTSPIQDRDRTAVCVSAQQYVRQSFVASSRL